jgi:hypothetical protein
MSFGNCCICLCVFNNEFGLPYVLKNIDKIIASSSLFQETKILVFYNESSDRSLQILNEYSNTNKNMEIIMNENQKTHSRTKNIAFARNSLIKRIREKYKNYEYFIMMDSNEYACIGDINTNIIKEVLERNDWDSISFDREAGYYDTWALSFDPYIYSFFHFSNWKKGVGMMREHFNKLLEDYKKNKPDELIPVYSAFNGFAIYRTEKFIDCTYNSEIDFTLFPIELIMKQQTITDSKIISIFDDDCEHRHFHLEAIQYYNAKIRISTKSVFSKLQNPPPNTRGPC